MLEVAHGHPALSVNIKDTETLRKLILWRLVLPLTQAGYFLELGEGDARALKPLHNLSDLSIERVLSVASDSVCYPFLWHQPGLVHMVPVDLLNVCHASGECHLISWSEPSQGEQSRKIGGSFESS